MRNCLVTKLKSSVDNPSLRKLDEVKLFIVPQTRQDSIHNTRLDIDHYAGEYTIRVDGNGYFALSEADLDVVANRKTTYTWTSSSATTTRFYFGPVACNVFISNKFGIYRLVNNGNTQQGIPYVCADLSEFKYMTQLKRLRFAYNDTYGDLADLKNLTLMEHIGFGYTKITGDISNFQPMKDHIVEVSLGQTGVTGNIADLGPLTLLYDFSLDESGVGGSVEGFVAAQIQNGRATCNNLSGLRMLTYITFGGTVVGYRGWTCLNWESNSRIFVGFGNSSLANCSTIWAKGATAEEIAAWQSAGKTVKVIE